MNTSHQKSSSNSIHSLASPASLSPLQNPLPPSLQPFSHHHHTLPSSSRIHSPLSFHGHLLHQSNHSTVSTSLPDDSRITCFGDILGSHALDSLEFRPAAAAAEAEPQVVLELPQDGSRRRQLGPFQLCLACKCCASASPAPVCVTMPCCFGIDCQLPNKPFGVCAFVPKSCNCTSCPV